MVKTLSLLGSTGSIGKNVLEVVKRFPGRFRVAGLAAGKNITLLRDQIAAFNPNLVSVADPKAASELSRNLPQGWKGAILSGPEGNEQIAAMEESDTVVSAIVGAAGLVPTLAALHAGKDVALANKETLVMAGDLVMRTARREKKRIIPIDSEHCAIFQALEAGRKEDVHKIILTASGGPFRNLAERQMWDVTPTQALAHPNWNMGRKITIDSATLMNKGLEVIEAKWLFDMDVEDIEVFIHPQSIVHSMVEFFDGSVIAQMGIPDMMIPIAYALAHPERLKIGLPRLDLLRQGKLEFFSPDFQRFPALKLAYHACKMGGTMPASLNAANELAVEAFLRGRIRFPEICLVVSETMSRSLHREVTDAKTVLEADLAARMQAESVIEAIEMKTRQRRGEDISLPTPSPVLR